MNIFSKIKKTFSSIKEKVAKVFKNKSRFKQEHIEQVRPNKVNQAEKLNKSLQYAKTTHSRYEEYFKNLDPIMSELMGYDYKPQPGDENQYFKIDEEYDPNKMTELFKHIEFKNLPDNQDIEYRVEAIENLPWSSEENLQKHKEDIARRSYLSNIASADRIDYYIVDTLEAIMNSSAAWRVASRDVYPSDQAKDQWTTLYKCMSTAYKNDSKLFDRMYQMIMNEDDFQEILNVFEEGMYKMLGE